MHEDMRLWQPIARRTTRGALAHAAKLALLLPVTVIAQSDSDVLAAVRECQQIDAMSSRLACYDRALPPTGESAPAASAAASQAGGAVAAARVVETDTRAARAGRAESPAAIEDGGISAIAVVDVRTRRPGETIFYVDDGRVFMQNGGSSRLRLPEPPFNAELEPGAFGSTFLRLPDDGPRVRVSLRD
jgi:hypothetical protein